MSDQPVTADSPGVTVTDNPDGTQVIHATATLEAAVATGNDDEENS
jgi:hypothetical protein